MKVDIFYNTGYDIINIPANPEIVYTYFDNENHRHEFNNVNIQQSDWLGNIIVEEYTEDSDYPILSWARNADYLIAYDDADKTRTCYIIDSYEKVSDTTIKYFLILDPYNTAGGMDPVDQGDGAIHEPIIVLGGNANRLTVPLLEAENHNDFRETETNKFFTLPEPFSPTERLHMHYDAIPYTPYTPTPGPTPPTPTPITEVETLLESLKTPYTNNVRDTNLNGYISGSTPGPYHTAGNKTLQYYRADQGICAYNNISAFFNRKSTAGTLITPEQVVIGNKAAFLDELRLLENASLSDAAWKNYEQLLVNMFSAGMDKLQSNNQLTELVGNYCKWAISFKIWTAGQTSSYNSNQILYPTDSNMTNYQAMTAQYTPTYVFSSPCVYAALRIQLKNINLDYVASLTDQQIIEI